MLHNTYIKTVSSIITLLILFMLSSCNSGRKTPALLVWQYVPHAIDGWTADDSLEIYNKENIFDYLDGGAEIYLKHSFKSITVVRFTKPEQPDITVELFDMTDSTSAESIYDILHTQKQSGIGQGYEYQGGSLAFRQGKMYIRIIADDDTSKTKEAIFNLARYIANHLQAE